MDINSRYWCGQGYAGGGCNVNCYCEYDINNDFQSELGGGPLQRCLQVIGLILIRSFLLDRLCPPCPTLRGFWLKVVVVVMGKALLDDDISDDVACVKIIYAQSGGFTAWNGWKSSCQNGLPNLSGC
uniref:lysozyme n=1 Tax=Timema californicum TaxID=61474 RepID=A0A7R9JIF4_TIMCA|nr:unnamed protein product [Timema californicum]